MFDFWLKFSVWSIIAQWPLVLQKSTVELTLPLLFSLTVKCELPIFLAKYCPFSCGLRTNSIELNRVFILTLKLNVPKLTVC